MVAYRIMVSAEVSSLLHTQVYEPSGRFQFTPRRVKYDANDPHYDEYLTQAMEYPGSRKNDPNPFLIQDSYKSWQAGRSTLAESRNEYAITGLKAMGVRKSICSLGRLPTLYPPLQTKKGGRTLEHIFND